MTTDPMESAIELGRAASEMTDQVAHNVDPGWKDQQVEDLQTEAESYDEADLI